jgi:hypothetical protein
MADVQPGYYNAVAVPVDVEKTKVWAQFGTSKKGTRQVVLHFEIIDGPEAGRRLPWIGFFTNDSWQRTMESLRFAGWSGDDLSALPSMPLDQVVSITVESDEYDGKTRSRITWVNQPGAGGVLKLAEPMSPDVLRQFAAQMKSKAALIPLKPGAKRTVETPKTSEPENNADDLGF